MSARSQPAALVTGATSGLGLALALRLAPTHRLVLSGRRDRAETDIPEAAIYARADLADPARAARTLATALHACGIAALELAILNAGTGRYGDPVAESAESIRETLAVNLAAPIALAHALHPFLEAAGGTLVLIGSVARRGSPAMASYAASKAGLDGFGRALAEEWRGKIRVVTLHPGPIATGMHEKAGFSPGRLAPFFADPDRMAAMVLDAANGRRPRRTLGTLATLGDRLFGRRGLPGDRA